MMCVRPLHAGLDGGALSLAVALPGVCTGGPAPARCVTCSLFEDEWMCQLRENALASERQLRRLRFPPVPRVTLYQVFRRPVPADRDPTKHRVWQLRHA